MQTRLHQLTLRTCVVRKSSRENGVKLEVFQAPDFDYVSGDWTGCELDVGESSLCPHITSVSALTLPFIENR